tara:strand:- start:764 stop:1267 length:504 start_codon:yes stop_codon:yes gene_type:complete
MKLSKPAWNNVIIFSVMIFILLINLTNNHLFSDSVNHEQGGNFVLSEHAVILTFSLSYINPANHHIKNINIARVGQSWKSSSKKLSVEDIQQLMHYWQQSTGLIQADNIEVTGIVATTAIVSLADDNNQYLLSLYPLSDQLLIKREYNQKVVWFSLPKGMSKQLIQY